MNRPLLAMLALAMLAVMVSAVWIGLSGLDHPVEVSRAGS